MTEKLIPLKPHPILFVDVGGTHTRFILSQGKALKTIADHPTRLSRLHKQTSRCLKNLKQPPKSIVFGMRGVWTARDKKKWTRRLGRLCGEVQVISDVELAHRLEFGNGPGIVLIAGTGSIAFGRSAAGRTARAGGLGPLKGDEGSGYWIGREFRLRQAKREISKATVQTWAENPRTVSKIARDTRRVLSGKTGLARSLQIEAVEKLVILVQSVQQQLRSKKKVPVKLRGGLFENRRFRRRLERSLAISSNPSPRRWPSPRRKPGPRS